MELSEKFQTLARTFAKRAIDETESLDNHKFLHQYNFFHKFYNLSLDLYAWYTERDNTNNTDNLLHYPMMRLFDITLVTHEYVRQMVENFTMLLETTRLYEHDLLHDRLGEPHSAQPDHFQVLYALHLIGALEQTIDVIKTYTPRNLNLNIFTKSTIREAFDLIVNDEELIFPTKAPRIENVSATESDVDLLLARKKLPYKDVWQRDEELATKISNMMKNDDYNNKNEEYIVTVDGYFCGIMNGPEQFGMKMADLLEDLGAIDKWTVTGYWRGHINFNMQVVAISIKYKRTQHYIIITPKRYSKNM